jgi:hypothetical protein
MSREIVGRAYSEPLINWRGILCLSATTGAGLVLSRGTPGPVMKTLSAYMSAAETRIRSMRPLTQTLGTSVICWRM